jgi:hypothetical protein
LTPETYKRLVHGRLRQGRWHVYPMPPNSALLTDALGLQLRCAHRAAKRER